MDIYIFDKPEWQYNKITLEHISNNYKKSFPTKIKYVYDKKKPIFSIKNKEKENDNIIFTTPNSVNQSYPHCREMVCSYLANNVPKSADYKWISENMSIGIKIIPVCKTNYTQENPTTYDNLIKDKKEYTKKISKCLSMINIIEKKFSWPLSTIVKTTIKQENILINHLNEFLSIYMIHFSPNWYRSSHTLSLALGLIRLTINDVYKGVRSYNGIYLRNNLIKKSYNDLSLLKSNNYNFGLSGGFKYKLDTANNKDHVIILETQDYWDLFFKNIDKLFKHNPHFNNSYSTEGFQKLSLYAHLGNADYIKDEILQKNFLNLIKTPIDIGSHQNES